MKIMIVEDDEHLSHALELTLSRRGHEISGKATDGESAIEMYRKAMPELTLIDLILPRMHGIDTVKEIIKINPEAKIILITGAQHEDLINEAIQSGAKTYLTKPFETDELINTIERL